MRMWALAIGVAMIGFNAMVFLGWVEAGKTIYAPARLAWLSNLLGGLLFGFGMVLASGCGSKTLLRIGGGSLKSLVVFIVMGVFAYMTMRGIFACARDGLARGAHAGGRRSGAPVCRVGNRPGQRPAGGTSGRPSRRLTRLTSSQVSRLAAGSRSR